MEQTLMQYLGMNVAAKQLEGHMDNMMVPEFLVAADQLLAANPPTEVTYTENGVAVRLADNTVVLIAPAAGVNAPPPPAPLAPARPTGDMQEDGGVVQVTSGKTDRGLPQRESY
jgi:hypothetical protein